MKKFFPLAIAIALVAGLALALVLLPSARAWTSSTPSDELVTASDSSGESACCMKLLESAIAACTDGKACDSAVACEEGAKCDLAVQAACCSQGEETTVALADANCACVAACCEDACVCQDGCCDDGDCEKSCCAAATTVAAGDCACANACCEEACVCKADCCSETACECQENCCKTTGDCNQCEHCAG